MVEKYPQNNPLHYNATRVFLYQRAEQQPQMKRQNNDQVTPTVMKTWGSGDFLYAAVRTGIYPSGIHHIAIDGREYPVAQVNPLHCNEYSIVRWVNRTEHFPEPIKGFNKPCNP